MSIIQSLLNRNPVNIKQVGRPDMPSSMWDGSVPPFRDAKGHAVFGDPICALRVAIKQLARYQLRDGLLTLRQIFAKWTDVAQDQDQYAAFVGLAINEIITRPVPLFFNDGRVRDKDKLYLFLAAMMEFELFNGFELPPETIKSAIALYENGL